MWVEMAKEGQRALQGLFALQARLFRCRLAL